MADFGETTLDTKSVVIVNMAIMSAFGILTDDFISLFDTSDRHVKETMKVDQYSSAEYFGRIYGIDAR